MNEKKPNAEQWLKELPVTREKPGFSPDEMAVCEKCSRKNPPTRLNCVYCGEQLKLSGAQADTAAPNLRQMEAWEKGYNIILLRRPGDSPPEESIRAVAQLLRWEPQDVKDFLQKESSLPIAKTESPQEAELIKQRLADAGFGSFILPDEEIAAETPARRLRGIELGDETVTFHLFNGGEPERAAWSDLALLVKGSLFEKKVASTEKRKKNEEKQVVESSETSHDEPVLDIYSRENGAGWRILTRGFDFSCLGVDKSLLAVENIKRLAELIGRSAANIRVDDGYLKARPLLGKVWDNEQKLASHNWQRETMGKFHFDNVTAISNNSQFTKYSRLQWLLLKGNR
jgi:hypothetical protein